MLEGRIEPDTLKVLDVGKDVRCSEPAEIGAEAIGFLKITALVRIRPGEPIKSGVFESPPLSKNVRGTPGVRGGRRFRGRAPPGRTRPHRLPGGGVNYSSISAGLVEFRRRVEAIQHNVIIPQFCRPIWRRFAALEVLSGRLPASGFERDAWLAARWITPKQE